jgi:hypothetical protein
LALVFIKELSPETLTIIPEFSVEDPLSPVVQVIATLVTVVTVQSTPSRVTSTFPITVPNPVPLI